jgi:hypothetical protein
MNLSQSLFFVLLLVSSVTSKLLVRRNDHGRADVEASTIVRASCAPLTRCLAFDIQNPRDGSFFEDGTVETYDGRQSQGHRRIKGSKGSISKKRLASLTIDHWFWNLCGGDGEGPDTFVFT